MSDKKYVFIRSGGFAEDGIFVPADQIAAIIRDCYIGKIDYNNVISDITSCNKMQAVDADEILAALAQAELEKS